MEVIIKGDEPLYKAHKEYKKFTHDDNMREIYEMRVEGQRNIITKIENAKEEGKKEGRKEGKKEGRKEGRKEGKMEIAKNMKKENISIEIITKITGLTKEEIQKL